MSAARAGFCGLLAASLALSLLPAALAAPPSLSYLGAAPPGAFRVDLAAVPGSGAMLVAATGPQGVEFSWLSEEGSLPATRGASFELHALFDDPALAAPRLAVLSAERAALAYVSQGSARLLLADPSTGELVADIALQAQGEVPAFPSVAAVDGGFIASYLVLGAPDKVVVAHVSSQGEVLSRGALPRAGALASALVPALPEPRLALLKESSVEMFTIGQGSTTTSAGAIAVHASSGALSARSGVLQGLFSTSLGLVRLSAPLDGLSPVASEFLPSGANALGLAASVSGDGLLVAAVRTSSSAFVLREEAIGRYSTAQVADPLSLAAASDTYGLARAVVLRAPAGLPRLETVAAGDFDAVETAIVGPLTAQPADAVFFTANFRAVRSPVTLVGLSLALPPQWTASAPSVSRSLTAGESASVTFTVAVPPGAAPQAYALTLTPSALEVSAPTSASFTLTVPAPASSVEGACCPADVELSPGESQFVSVSLLNRGSQVVSTQVTPQAPSGFLVSPSGTTVTLSPGDRAQVGFSVTVAQGALPLERGTLTLVLRPDDGSGESRIELGARVRAVFAPTLALSARDLSAAPGASVALQYSLVNLGNSGGLVALAAEVTGLPRSALSGLQGLVFVPGYGRVDLPLTLTVPANALAGTAFEVALSASLGAGGEPLGGAEAMRGTVRPAGSASARVLSGGPVAPGQEGRADLVVENAANAAASMDIAFGELPDEFAARVEGASSRVALEPFGSLTVTLVFRAPEGALPGARILPLTLTPVGGLSIPLEVQAEVLETHALALRVLTPGVTLSGARTHEATLDFEVTNGGNAGTSLIFASSAPLLSLSSLPAQGAPTRVDTSTPFALSPFESRTLRAVVSASFAAGADLLHERITVDSTSGDRAVGLFDLTRLRSDAVVTDIRVRALGTPGLVGEVYQVLGTVSNVGEGTAVGLQVVLTADGTIVGARRDVEALNPGAALTFDFEFVPRKESTELTLLVLSDEPALDRDRGNNARSLTLTVEVPAPPPSAIVQAAPPAAASVSLFALIGLALSEVGKSTLISVLFLPLYVKLKPNEVLDQYLRGQIHGYIIANPGEHYNAIKEQLGVTNGALAYHLRVLERSGYIRATREGMYKRFWPQGVKIPKRRRLSAFQDAVVKAVRDNPEASQKRIAELLGASNQVINYHVKQLEEAHILKVDRTHRSSRLTLGPEAPPGDAGLLPPAPPAPLQPSGQ